ncbi:tyrosine phosphatase family-domain-containing protein [Entophlyctis helioformis]|nr:tyrosine phosphatase family-domain-containing protein [Entophlyctis helioformis]
MAAGAHPAEAAVASLLPGATVQSPAQDSPVVAAAVAQWPATERERVLVPPLNFAMVEPGVYRSGYPNKKNFPFLKKLGLQSVMYICDDDYTPENLAYWQQNHINVFHIKVAGNKEPFGEINQADIADALVKVLDRNNHPILIHCNKGKHRIGCLVGCLRKLQKWSMASIFDEYRRFSGTKLRIADQEFIEVFDACVDADPNSLPSWAARE